MPDYCVLEVHARSVSMGWFFSMARVVIMGSFFAKVDRAACTHCFAVFVPSSGELADQLSHSGVLTWVCACGQVNQCTMKVLCFDGHSDAASDIAKQAGLYGIIEHRYVKSY